MAYVEYLRARTSLGWHLLILAAIVALGLYFGGATFIVNDVHKPFAGTRVPLGALVPIAMFFAAIFASGVGSSLNLENQTRDLSWTKPMSRTLVAIQYQAIDVAAIAIEFTLALLGTVLVLSRLQGVPIVDETFVPQIVLGLGVAVMWFGLVQMLTAWVPRRVPQVGGILWPVSLLLIALAKAPGPLGALSRGIDLFNPLAYMSGVSYHSSTGPEDAISTLSLDERLIAVWLLAVVFCAVAVYLWPRREA